MTQLRQRGHLHTKTVNKSEKVKRNRTALDIKSRLFVFSYEEALVYHSEQEERVLKSSKFTLHTSGKIH